MLFFWLQTEAKYAHECRCPIIPLIVERGFQLDGWLGMLVKTTMYVDFSQDTSFNDAMKILIKEIEGKLKELQKKCKYCCAFIYATYCTNIKLCFAVILNTERIMIAIIYTSGSTGAVVKVVFNYFDYVLTNKGGEGVWWSLAPDQRIMLS